MAEYLKFDESDNRYPINPDFRAVRNMMDLVYCAMVDDTYLVAYNIDPIWHNPGQVFINEYLIIKLDNRRSSFKKVVMFFDEIKSAHQATHIVVGDYLSSNQERYERLLSKHGFKPIHKLYMRY